MLDSNALDNVIALVVVILLLSLIVQSIQSALKKALKIKSRQIEDSLIDLFENVLQYDANKRSASGSANGSGIENTKAGMSAWLEKVSGPSPLLRRIYETLSRRLHPADPNAHPDPTVKRLFDEVTHGFQQVGRVAQSGKQMLDSISKDDLKKVMGKVLPNSLLPEFSEKLARACSHIANLDDAIKEVGSEYHEYLSGDASAKFAAMQKSLAPLLNDLRAVYKGQQVNASVMIEDIINLRDIKLGDALELLGETQKKVEADLEAANKSKASGDAKAEARAEVLEKLSAALRKIAQALTKLNEGLDAAIAPLRSKLNEVETWYDTVMQSFEERYTRGMKTWAIVISFLVVAYLNANVFTIYKNISTNEVLRNQLVQLGQERAKAREVRAQSSDTTKADENLDSINQELDRIQMQVSEYSSLGFQPLTWQGVEERFNYHLWSSDGWFSRRADDFKTLFGWIVMTMLLSVGAPFWQDTLESLFGVKNLLRKNTGTKNVEAESGQGQPRP